MWPLRKSTLNPTCSKRRSSRRRVCEQPGEILGPDELTGRGSVRSGQGRRQRSKPEGLAALKKALHGIPRQQPVVLYCGCCPWTDCPNVRPAYRVAREMGFKNVRALYIAKNLQYDWIDKGLAISQGDQ
jgi:hypothetical protein